MAINLYLRHGIVETVGAILVQGHRGDERVDLIGVPHVVGIGCRPGTGCREGHQ